MTLFYIVTGSFVMNECYRATPLFVMLRHDTTRLLTPHHPTTPRHATSRHVTALYATPRHATPRHTTPRHFSPRHTTLRHATPRRVTARHATSHLAMPDTYNHENDQEYGNVKCDNEEVIFRFG